MSYSTTLIHNFPKAIDTTFNLETYQEKFGGNNFIVNASTTEVEYGKHWGLLSIKCAFNGTEYYEAGNGFYGVNDSAFLIFNEGTIRSSYISSDTPVESFSVSFSPEFVSSFLAGYRFSPDHQLEEPFCPDHQKIEFTEQLHVHDPIISPYLSGLRALSKNGSENHHEIEETLPLLFEAMIHTQKNVWLSMRKLAFAKSSTKKELYTRLNRAKDYITTHFKTGLTLRDMASVACLNPYYFLREFKKLFQITPYQYLQNTRLDEAWRMLNSTDKTVNQVCNEVGYSDIASFSKLFKKKYQYPPSKKRLKKRAVL